MEKMKPGTSKLINNKITVCIITVSFIVGVGLLANVESVQAQQTDSYPIGNPLGLTSGSDFEPISSNVKVYGAIHSAESCVYDVERDLIIVPSMGERQNVKENNAWVSLINSDGSVHTTRWIGIQNSGQRSNLSPPLVFNDPLGSEIRDGVLYFADRNGGISGDDPIVAVIRRIDLETGATLEDIRIEESPWINNIAVTEDGTIYTTQTGDLGQNPDPQSWRVWKITPEGDTSVFAVDNPINQPNGIVIDQGVNIVVANFGNPDVMTFSPEGDLSKTEKAVQAGSDKIEIMADGTKYISSVTQGGVTRINPGETAELIPENIPSPASMSYDAGANQLVIPMTSQSTLAFIPLD